jgi:uncharacterized protein
MKRTTRLWIRFALLVLLAGGVYLVLREHEQHLVYAPRWSLTRTPRDAGMPFDNIALVSEDGVNIQGWFVPAESPPPATNSSTATLLLLHGRSGNISDCLEKIHIFHDMGLDVFTIDYHGYGTSAGAPSERALVGDALAAYFYLTDTRHVKPERLYLYGQDLGAAVAIDLATKAPAAGLITEGAVASLIGKVKNDWPLIPWQYLLANQFDSLAKIGDVNIPVLMIHSTNDDLVPFGDSRRLYLLAHDPKELVELHGTHQDAFVSSYDTYYDKIVHFVSEQPQAGSVKVSSSTQTNGPASKEPTP